jgi:glycogen debranching enzyme
MISLRREGSRIKDQLFDSSYFVESHRLPELFCGFPRRRDEGPTNYPVACSPQAWSAGALFLLIQSALGLSIDASKQEVFLFQPALPDFLQELRIMNLRIGKATIDLSLERHEFTVGVNVLRKKGNVKVVTIK